MGNDIKIRKIIKEALQEAISDIEKKETKDITDAIQKHIDLHLKDNRKWYVGTSSTFTLTLQRKGDHIRESEKGEHGRNEFKHWMKPIYSMNSQVIEMAELEFVENEDLIKKTHGGSPLPDTPPQHYIYAYQCIKD